MQFLRPSEFDYKANYRNGLLCLGFFSINYFDFKNVHKIQYLVFVQHSKQIVAINSGYFKITIKFLKLLLCFGQIRLTDLKYAPRQTCTNSEVFW